MGNKQSGEGLPEAEQLHNSEFGSLDPQTVQDLYRDSINDASTSVPLHNNQIDNKANNTSITPGSHNIPDNPSEQQGQPPPATAQPIAVGGGNNSGLSTDGVDLQGLNPLQNNTKKVGVEDFSLISVVGKGSFGKVFSVRKNDTGKIYAMKVLKKDHILKKKQVAHTQTERRILESIDHPFIVSLRYAFQTPDKLYLVLDMFTGGELFFHLKTYGRFHEQLACFYAAELLLALECLHSHNIIYRDLKPENVLLDDDGHVRLTDFGLSKEIQEDGQIMTICGTPEYLAPEIINRQGYGKEVDFWSLGTLVYEMICSIPPFYNSNVHVMYQRIMQAPLHFPPGLISPEGESFLEGLLQRDPSKRLGSGVHGMAQIKSHPWFQLFGLNFDLLYQKRIIPPFRPSQDQPNIDDEFRNEPVADTPLAPSTLGNKTRVKFPQFSYQSPDLDHLNSMNQQF